MRVVPDTNVLISGFVYPNGIPGKIINAWRHKKIEFCISHYILDEFVRVMPKIENHPLDKTEIRELADILVFFSDVVNPEKAEILELRDANDQLVLGTLVASGADHLITGDKDLLALSSTFPIITPRGFWTRYGF